MVEEFLVRVGGLGGRGGGSWRLGVEIDLVLMGSSEGVGEAVVGDGGISWSTGTTPPSSGNAGIEG